MNDLKGTTVASVNSHELKTSQEKKNISLQRKKIKAAEELKVLNNIVSPNDQRGVARNKKKRASEKRSTERILKDRKRDENKSKSKSFRRIRDRNTKRWIGWRESIEEVAPVKTYNIYPDKQE
ncbi:hypothetical protein J8340_22695 [Escherichia coli]|nr:hypothetical protein [Escherichia coli]